VRYRVADLLVFVEKSTRISTSDSEGSPAQARADGLSRRCSSSRKDGVAAVATTATLFAAALLAGALAARAFAFETRPNPNTTGGSVRIDGHDLSTTCGHAKEHRGSLRRAFRDEILMRYGLSPGTHPDYEIDHLIPLCLGGSDDPSNLWAQPRRSIEPIWNAEAKDRLERFMCDMVCNRQLDLTTAQKAFAEDWIAAYHKYYEAH
jgi:hypothetical protein